MNKLYRQHLKQEMFFEKTEVLLVMRTEDPRKKNVGPGSLRTGVSRENPGYDRRKAGSTGLGN